MWKVKHTHETCKDLVGRNHNAKSNESENPNNSSEKEKCVHQDESQNLKDEVTAKSIQKAEYQAMAHGCCEMLRPRIFLEEMGSKQGRSTVLPCDSDSTIKLTKNPAYHDKTKHVEVDCYFIRERIEERDAVLAYTNTLDQIADSLTKAASRNHLNDVLSKLGMGNICSPA